MLHDYRKRWHTEDMTKKSNGTWAESVAEIRATWRAGIWPVLVGAVLLFSLIGAILSVTQDSSSSGVIVENIDRGRAAYSIAALITLIIALFAVPVVLNNARKDDEAPAPANVTLTVARAVVASLVVAAIPALTIGAVASTGTAWDFWLIAGTLVVEVGLFALMSAFIHILVSRRGTAVVLNALVVGTLAVGPFVVAAVVGASNSVTVTQTYIGIEWNEKDDIDPATGYPEVITCMAPEVTTTSAPNYGAAWPIMAVTPFVTLAEAAPFQETYGTYDYGYVEGDVAAEAPLAPEYSEPPRLVPGDVLSSIAMTFREAQVNSVDQEVTIDECAAAKEGTTAYWPSGYTPTAEELRAAQPGWLIGIGTHVGVVLALGIAALIRHSRARRRA